MKLLGGAGVLAAALALSSPAAAQDAFPSGSLIIPMDIDYQDAGMLRAFGLVYRLLLNDVPVAWCIMPGKSLYTGSTKSPSNAGNAVDFMAAAKDVRTGASVGTVRYRGGPFVVDAAHRTKALTIVTAWNNGQSNVVNVHEATAGFDAFIERVLVNAPSIAINADGNEPIAYGYMNAAGIPDSAGSSWTGTSPGVMTPAQIAGTSTTDHRDGTLWGLSGLPRYCQLMSMHWNVSRDAVNNEAVAEMSEYLLNYPVHLFAECQAVNQLEDAPSGHFVSTDNGTGTPTKSLACGTTMAPNNGLCAKKPTPDLPLDFLNSHLPFAQLDGPFKTVGGSEPAYGLAPGSTYYDQGIVMIREKNVAGGVNGKADIWMTGFANTADDICTISETGTNCVSRGKVSYLGGHEYGTKVPISANGDTQGTRLFLNSLFEAECVIARGAADVRVFASAPAFTSAPLVTFTLDWNNAGAGVALNVRLTDMLPAGVAFVSATGGGTFSAGQVTWDLGDLAARAAGSVSVTVALPSYGSYDNSATASYRVGNNTKTSPSNTTTTVYGASPPDAGGQPDGGSGDLCAGVTCPGPTPADPCKVGACNTTNGACGIIAVADGTPCDDSNVCTVGTTCTAGVCGGGAAMQCAPPANACQTAACVAGTGCVVSNLGNGSACSTGDQCVIGQSCVDGVCSGGASRACLGSASPCQAAICNPATGCGFQPGNNGASCDDGDVCTTGSTCANGLCQGGTGCAMPTAPCRLAVCGTNGCETTFAAAGTDPRGDCPSIGGCARSCDGAGSCTTCPPIGGSGGGGGGGAGGGGGSSAGGTAGGGSAGTGGAGGGGASGSGGAIGSGGSSGGSGGSNAGTAGTGGSNAGTGGSNAGTGGSNTGTGGSAAGTGGSNAGAGGSTAGTGGSNAGTGGSGGGSGGSNAGAGGSNTGTGGSDMTSASGCGCGVRPASGATTPPEIFIALALMIGLSMRRRRRASALADARAPTALRSHPAAGPAADASNTT